MTDDRADEWRSTAAKSGHNCAKKLFQIAPKLVLALGAVVGAVAPAYAQDAAGVCRVTDSALAGTDGVSWANAMGLEAALANTSCAQIWLKQGLYKQSTEPKGFFIARNLKLYGGFLGSEASMAARANPVDRTLTQLDGEKARGVLYIKAAVVGTSGGITSDTVIDGLTIQNGLATQIEELVPGGYNLSGGGIYCNGAGVGNTCNPVINNVLFLNNLASHRGGALYAEGNAGNASPTITNSRFEGNQAIFGGAMYNNGTTSGTSKGVSNPTIKNTTFANNKALDPRTATDPANAISGQGGAMLNWGGGGTSSPTIDSCTFSGNTAVADGGAILNWGLSGVSSPSIINSTFSGNSSGTQGGAINNYGFVGKSNPTIVNSTFSGNSANTGGAIINIGTWGAATPVISGSILWGNTVSGTGSAGPQIYNSGGKPTVKNSVVEGTLPSGTTNGGGNSAVDPLLGALANNGGLTSTMMPGVGSSAIDLYACDVTSPLTDQRGVSRPQGTKCDAGAVERVTSAQTLAVTVQGAGAGSVSDTLGGISSCTAGGGTCAGSYSDATSVFTTLTAVAPAGSTFDGWAGDACAGSVAPTCEFIVDKSKNLTATFTVFTVGPVTLPSVVYGTAFSQALSVSGGAGPFTYAASNASHTALGFDPATATLSAPASLPAGTYTIDITATDSKGAQTLPTTVTLTVSPVPLTITANDANIAYGQALPALSVRYSGWVNGETSAVLSVAPTVSTTATATSPAGSYPITASGAASSNYSITYVAGTLTIGQAASGITISSTPNPSQPGQEVSFGIAVALDATKRLQAQSPLTKAAAVPTGTVTLTDGSTVLGTAALDAMGQATLTVKTLTTVGTHSIVASYSGDANFPAFTSAAFMQTVSAATAEAVPVPSLGTWAVLLLNLMAAVLGALGLRWRRDTAQA